MYSQIILFGISIKINDKSVIYNSLALSTIGAIIAGYHYLLQIGIVSLTCIATFDCSNFYKEFWLYNNSNDVIYHFY